MSDTHDRSPFIIRLNKQDASEAPSRQKDQKKWLTTGVVEPKVPFELLVRVCEETFLIGGIIARISATAASGWRMSEKVSPELRSLLQSIDQRVMFTGLYTTGNYFLERIKKISGSIARLEPFITSEVRVTYAEKQVGYVQGRSFGDWEEKFTPEDVVHIRIPSISDRYYGASPIEKCTSQISLLSRIDRFYDRKFERGFLSSSILLDSEGKLTKDQRDGLKTMIEDRMKGIENSFTTMVLSGKYETISLDETVDSASFLEYRRDLIKSIALALNIPYDLLISDSSNRATSQASLEAFNRDIVTPLQSMVMQQLQNQLRASFPDIDEVSFVPVDISNQQEEMQVRVWYRNAGILTANEIREEMGYAAADGGDTLEVPPRSAQEQELQTTESVEKSIKSMHEKLLA